jgi:cell surface protein SprA
MCFAQMEAYGQIKKQLINPADSLLLKYRFKDRYATPFFVPNEFSLKTPENIKRTVEYDPKTNLYIIREMVGDKLYRLPQYLTFKEYQEIELARIKGEYWHDLVPNAPPAGKRGLGASIKIRNKIFETIFGGNTISVTPRGSAELTFAGKINKNENPLFNEKQRIQRSFNFDQNIQMNLVGKIGERLKLNLNYSTQAQFDFENQIKLDFPGKKDDILQRLEIGTVSFPLTTQLISGTQALFGVKTQLQFGRLGVTTLFSQQRSQAKEIKITNGSQQSDFRITSDSYEANKHYFLSQYFRNSYNKAMSNLPIITSAINITKIEVWVTNKNNSTTDSRDILAFMDLGENRPYNTTLFQGGSGYNGYPSAFTDPNFPQEQSNNLLQKIPTNSRLTNSNDIDNYFQGNGGTDNYTKITYARKLTDREYTLNPALGFISLNASLNSDEVLAVSYRYTVNGVEYQVGEFTNDLPVDAANPKVLYAKLLKNQTIKTNLPIWKLMMKNIYSLGAYGISSQDFKLAITRVDNEKGIEKPLIDEGAKLSGKLWLQVLGLDRINQQSAAVPDGYFDFIPGVTIDPANGRIFFPYVEPFGEDLKAKFNPGEQPLIDKYVYQPLYDSTQSVAQQNYPNLNRYIIKGTYQSSSGSEFQLNAINVPEGSVVVTAGTLKLIEGADYTVDYNVGKVKILNTALLNSGQPIIIKLESNELFGVQQKSLFGTRLDYKLSDKVNFGATYLKLTEQPITPKVNFGEESVANSIYGFDVNYSSSSRFLTRMIDKLPFISTKAPSTISFNGEFAKFQPGHPKALNFAGSSTGTSYIDDFESTQSVIDLKSSSLWQISGTPQDFPESQLSNDLAYGYNRAKLSFFNIDPLFYNRSGNLTPANIRNNKTELSDPYVREVIETEVFPYKQNPTGTTLSLATFNLAYYPMLRGPYNFTSSGLNSNGTFNNPTSKWGGIFRKIDNNDFEALNIEFIEFWVLDPFIKKPNSAGGDLYFNLGNISEDVLKDGRKSLENGLPADDDPTRTDETVWGKVPKIQPVIQAFDNNPDIRQKQDVGLDGLNDALERVKFQPVLQPILGQLNPAAAAKLNADPSSDNYTYFRGSNLDNQNAGILKRYEDYNGTEGNSKTSQQSLDQLGIDNSASTSLPDGEDNNRDNNLTRSDEYFQYKVSMRPQDLEVGKNYIVDKITSNVKLINGSSQNQTWYQFRVPISQYTNRVGNIQDFKSIRFMRLFMTDFADTSILRFAKLQLIRGEWRRYNAERNILKVIQDTQPTTGLDNSVLNVGVVNIEDNGTKTPIPYVVPPGIAREKDYSNFSGNTRRNEQSLLVKVQNLRDGYSRAAYKTTTNDFRSYKRLQMFIHAEGDQLKDGDVDAFLRVGTDYQENYYEYDIPLKITQVGTRDPELIWPQVNRMDIEFRLFQLAKTARNAAIIAGKHPSESVPFYYSDGKNTIVIKGQPDLSKVRTLMLGIRNPTKNTLNDDGLDKTAEVWFNELRVTDFDERSGWAATARMNAQLADFGDITVSANKSTIGFGSLEQRVSETQREDNKSIDIAGSLELGKFFPAKAGVKVPVTVNYSTQVATPEYDPKQQDIPLKTVLNSLTPQAQKEVLDYSQNVTTRKSINFTNIRKIKTDPTAKNHLWDIENLDASYSYNELDHHDFINKANLQKNYHAAFGYNYSNAPKFYTPLQKRIKNNMLALLRDVNFNLLPSVLNFRIEVNRLYSENSLRDNNDPTNFIPVNTTFNKNFTINRLYGISWDLTKSLKLDFNATNLGVVDEPEGRITGLKRDTLWQNLQKLGRTTNYNHTLNLSYTVPLNKIPGLDFIGVVTRYQTNFTWQSQPLLTLDNPNINFGNNIQNQRTVQINPTLNFVNLYNKFGFYKRLTVKDTTKKTTIGQFFLKALLSLKNVSGTYTRNDGTFLPGYLPKTQILGYDFDANAPGIGFLFGSQNDIRNRALANGWITSYPLQNLLYVNTMDSKLNLRGTLEPVTDLRIELTAFKNETKNYSSNFRFDSETGAFSNLSPVTNGSYSVSFIALGTAFTDKNSSALSSVFQNFLSNREIISRRLGRLNPNSGSPTSDGFADGYSKNSQDVLVPAFIAAYKGKNASTSNLNSFPSIPLPNWRITYNGLSKIPVLSELFTSVDITHGYISTYNVNSFNSLIRYSQANGAVNVRDVNSDFLPSFQFSQVTIFEQFVPLIGVDVRMKNNITANAEYRKSRALSFGITNSQLAQQNDAAFVFGFGYRTKNFRFPFGLLKGVTLKNDLNFKLDIALRDTKTVIYRADINDAEVSSGSKNVTYRPSIDYVINQRFNVRFFYDTNITKPYTSQTFNTAFTNFGINLKFTIQ